MIRWLILGRERLGNVDQTILYVVVEVLESRGARPAGVACETRLTPRLAKGNQERAYGPLWTD